MRNAYRKHVGRRVVVQIIDDVTVVGTLDAASFDALTIRDAEIVANARTESARMDGLAIVPTLSIAWIQVA